MTWDPLQLRGRFPALELEVAGRPAVFFDGPAGSQVPVAVVEAMNRALVQFNANLGGHFVTSVGCERALQEAHRRVAEFMGTEDPGEVVFGPNMTTLTLALARAIGRTWEAGDEIVVSRMEHDANYTPWTQAARDAGVEVRHIEVNRDDCTLDLDSLDRVLGARTRLVAVGAASNMVGTVNPVAEIVNRAHAANALVFVDAVHYAPHRTIDVEAWGADFVACSAYKFFGPHVGVLWGRRSLLEETPVYKLRPASDRLPDRWMTGTQNHEGIVGTAAAIDHIASLGDDATEGRARILSAFDEIGTYEGALSERLIAGIQALDGFHVWGITDPSRFEERVPTLSVTHARHKPVEIARRLGEQGIFVWDGNFYALPLTEALGLEPDGTLRIGLLHYNTSDEVDRLLAALAEL
ncbi:MAG: cysteine desulfurase-like protein [Acidobacteria bacterium]|nr:cysteine desulfurase-like protein [Acidobacteriota bacterium]NIM62475.1 cysteine desulfurase-like protein [Acidobacteriota bacterium]NIO59033.1 cysteine desulfurase-like protein [Acidobacteriota bacterium]NIQ29298.1 cysteine desulfurase-like protein [Acidobacteriota bacterium]NIQ86441.1 cysteine desulfurase-like protein [Acidobacteriota bacterium]